MKEYSGIKKLHRDIVGKWIELEKFILGEATKISKDKHGMY